MLRISTQQLHRNGLESMLRNQTQLARVQSQIGTGLKINTAADDPGAKSRLLGIEHALGNVQTWQSNVGLLQDRLTLEESTLSDVNDTLDRVRTLAIQSVNAGLSQADKQSIVAELKELSATLLTQANVKDGQGRYLFAGSADSAAPFVSSNGVVSYVGNGVVPSIQVGSSRDLLLGDSGDEVFMRLKTGNGVVAPSAAATNTGTASVSGLDIVDSNAYDGGTYTVRIGPDSTYDVLDASNAVISSGSYTSGNGIEFRGLSLKIEGPPEVGDQFTVAPSQARDVFATVARLSQIVSTSSTTAADQARNQTDMFEVMAALDQILDHSTIIRGGVGARLRAADDANAQLSAVGLQLQSTQSGLQDLDYVEASTRLSQKQVALQAAQQTYLKIQGLSLFNFL